MLDIHPDAKGLIFDVDGTLADTMGAHQSAWRDAFLHFGVRITRKFLDEVRGMPSERIVERYNRLYHAQLDPHEVSRVKTGMVQDKLRTSKPFEAVAALVYRNHGQLPMAVASGGKRVNVDIILEAIGLTGYFDTVVTADDEVDHKPEPGIFLETARRIGVEPRFCQVFEDGESGFEAARKAGMIVTDVRPFCIETFDLRIPEK